MHDCSNSLDIIMHYSCACIDRIVCASDVCIITEEKKKTKKTLDIYNSSDSNLSPSE